MPFGRRLKAADRCALTRYNVKPVRPQLLTLLLYEKAVLLPGSMSNKPMTQFFSMGLPRACHSALRVLAQTTSTALHAGNGHKQVR